VTATPVNDASRDVVGAENRPVDDAGVVHFDPTGK
jgi:hypothetical protein